MRGNPYEPQSQGGHFVMTDWNSFVLPAWPGSQVFNRVVKQLKAFPVSQDNINMAAVWLRQMGWYPYSLLYSVGYVSY